MRRWDLKLWVGNAPIEINKDGKIEKLNIEFTAILLKRSLHHVRFGANITLHFISPEKRRWVQARDRQGSVRLRAATVARPVEQLVLLTCTTTDTGRRICPGSPSTQKAQEYCSKQNYTSQRIVGARWTTGVPSREGSRGANRYNIVRECTRICARRILFTQRWINEVLYYSFCSRKMHSNLRFVRIFNIVIVSWKRWVCLS